MTIHSFGEPWRVRGCDAWAFDEVVACTEAANFGGTAERIVACVNALAGMDPAALGGLVAVLDELFPLDGVPGEFSCGSDECDHLDCQLFRRLKSALAALKAQP